MPKTCVTIGCRNAVPITRTMAVGRLCDACNDEIDRAIECYIERCLGKKEMPPSRGTAREGS